MESKIFARLNFDPGVLVIGSVVATIILIILVLMLILRQSRLETNYKIFMRGKGGRSLQEVFRQQLESMDIIKEQTDILHRRLTYVEKSMNRSFQKCGIVKYDAFKEFGGQLSFAMALLNDSNTGFIINCIYSRDGSYTYIKDIIRGECSIELCDEEQEALRIALETAGSTPAVTATKKKKKKKLLGTSSEESVKEEKTAVTKEKKNDNSASSSNGSIKNTVLRKSKTEDDDDDIE